MAVVAIEGFDHLSSSQIGAKGLIVTAGAVGMGAGVYGGQAIALSSGAATLTKLLPTTYTTIICGFRFKTDRSLGELFNFRSDGVTQTLRLICSGGGSNKLAVLNAAGTVIATGTTPIIVGAWYYIEVKLVVSGASGSCEVHLNGVSEIGSTTGNFGTAPVDRIIFYNVGQGGADSSWTDDVYCVDTTGPAPRNTFLGDVRVETLSLNAEGADTAWAASSGTKVACIDQTTSWDSDTDYISSSTPGDRETFTTSPLSIAAGGVLGVQVVLVARKDDGGARTIAPVIRMAGTDHDGPTSIGLSASYLALTTIYDTDPTGSAWSIASVNAAEFGVKEVA